MLGKILKVKQGSDNRIICATDKLKQLFYSIYLIVYCTELIILLTTF